MKRALHPLRELSFQVIEWFSSKGFSIKFGPSVVSTKANFDDLLVPHDHPAKKKEDSFYVGEKSEDLLLRTHNTVTSLPAAFKGATKNVAVLDCVFRVDDADCLHFPQFIQMDFAGECGDLDNPSRFVTEFVTEFVHYFLGVVELRVRETAFPFTNPSFEIDVRCCEGGCKRCGDEEWIELVGFGIVKRDKDRGWKIDGSGEIGMAGGIGIDRLALLKFGVRDIRHLYSNNFEFLSKVGGNLPVNGLYSVTNEANDLNFLCNYLAVEGFVECITNVVETGVTGESLVIDRAKGYPVQGEGFLITDNSIFKLMEIWIKNVECYQYDSRPVFEVVTDALKGDSFLLSAVYGRCTELSSVMFRDFVECISGVLTGCGINCAFKKGVHQEMGDVLLVGNGGGIIGIWNGFAVANLKVDIDKSLEIGKDASFPSLQPPSIQDFSFFLDVLVLFELIEEIKKSESVEKVAVVEHFKKGDRDSFLLRVRFRFYETISDISKIRESVEGVVVKLGGEMR